MRVVPLAALLWSFPVVAAAESAIVLVTGNGESLDQERARSGAIEVLAERAVRLVPLSDEAPCDDIECAPALAAENGVDFVVVLAVQGASGGEQQVRVTWVPPHGTPSEAIEPVSHLGVGAAAGAALETLLGRRRDHRRGFLVVRSTPAGGRVEVDGEFAGTTPLRRMTAPGEHSVRLVPASGEAVERRVIVTELAETTVDFEEEGQQPAPPESAAEGPVRSEPSPFNWLLGGGLAVAGIVALISPLQTLAQDGECVDLIERVGCVEKVQFGAQSGVLMGLGLALLTSAVIVDAVAPIRVEVQVDETRGMLWVGARF